MPFYITNISVWIDTGVLILWAFILSIIFTSIEYKNNPNKLLTFISIFTFSILGTIIGYITGQSREPAVTAVLPSVLTFIGGISLYILGQENNKSKLLTSICIIVFSISLFVGIQWGVNIRENYYKEKKESQVDYNTTKFKLKKLKQEHLINIERILYEDELLEMRRELGLEIQDNNTSNNY